MEKLTSMQGDKEFKTRKTRVKPVRFIKIKAKQRQECRYCDNLPTRILLFSDWTECFVCEKCLVTKAKFKVFSKNPMWRGWNLLSHKKTPNFLSHLLPNAVLK